MDRHRRQTAPTTCWRSKPAARSRAPAPTTPPACRSHFDNQSIFKERIYRDKADPNILHDEITVIDHALTRPWTVDKKYVRDPNPRPDWTEVIAPRTSSMIAIGKDNYFLSGDGMLMPVRKDQAPPDLRYFKQTRK